MFRVSSETVHSLKKEKENPISRVTLNYVTLSSYQFPLNVVRTWGKYKQNKGWESEN